MAVSWPWNLLPRRKGLFEMERVGRLEVISGGMFSGKTEELLRRLDEARYDKKVVLAFKPRMDRRYTEEPVIVSHARRELPCHAVESPVEILEITAASQGVDVVGIDECQFFDKRIAVEAVRQLVYSGFRVIVAGLDMDYSGRPFGAMGDLMAIADDVVKLHATCDVCGNPAVMHQRTDRHDAMPQSQEAAIGGAEVYAPRCRLHHETFQIYSSLKGR